MIEIDTTWQENPICPHCGQEIQDAWEINFGPGCDGDVDITCGKCDKEYFCSRQCIIRYSTEKKD